MDRYGVRQATELILCCSYFNMLSRFLESTRVELEPQPPLPSARRPWERTSVSMEGTLEGSPLLKL